MLRFFQRLTEPLPDGNENQRRSSTEYDFHYFANAETDTDSDAEANDTVTIKRELGIEQIGFDEADVEPEKPKMYFEWLDKKTLVKIFGEFESFYRKPTSNNCFCSNLFSLSNT